MVLDPRAKELARIIVDYSVNIQLNEIFLVQAEDTFREFAEFMGGLADKKGAKTLFDYHNLNEKKAMIERDDREELEMESRRVCALAEIADARSYVDADSEPLYLESIDPKKITDFEKLVRRPMLERLIGNGKEFPGIKWNLVGYPCEGAAKSAGMTLEEYENFLYDSTNIDWAKTREKMQRVKDVFDDAEQVCIYVPGQTDLTLSLKGRGAQIGDGRKNMPDGEVFYGPVEDSANGVIYFPYPTIRDGKTITGIRLTYKDGEVTDFSAEKNQEFLETMLNLKGVKRIGEFGIGCNYGVKRYTKELLFDEKLGGSIHLALGNSYKMPLSSGGGLNEGDAHWDNVCDLRRVEGNPGGELYANGKLVQRNGVWLFD